MTNVDICHNCLSEFALSEEEEVEKKEGYY